MPEEILSLCRQIEEDRWQSLSEISIRPLATALEIQKEVDRETEGKREIEIQKVERDTQRYRR